MQKDPSAFLTSPVFRYLIIGMASPIPLIAPIFLPGQEPLPPGVTPEERGEMQQAIKYQKMLASALESCPLKMVMSGGAGELHAYTLWSVHAELS